MAGKEQKTSGRWVDGAWIPEVEGRAVDPNAGVAVADAQEAARRKIVGAVDATMPRPPNTTGMGLSAAAAANTTYKKALAAWEAKRSKTAGAQASAIEQ